MMPVNRNISYYRGDSYRMRIFPPMDGGQGSIANAIFTIRKSIDGERIFVLDKNLDPVRWDLNAWTLDILPGDLDGAEPGSYVYDVEVTWTDGTRRTAQAGAFIIEGDVTNDVANDIPLPGEYHITSSQKIALDAADAPSGTNPFATKSAVSSEIALHETNYNHANIPTASQKAALDAASTLGAGDPVAAKSEVNSVASSLAAHEARVDNPHAVTAGQIGAEPAGSVANHELLYSHINIPTTAQKAALDAANAPSPTNPFATLADISSGGGGLSVVAGSATISSGSITINPQQASAITVSAESGTADDLDTINGGAAGDIILLQAAAGHTITFRTSGNISMPLSGGMRLQDYAPVLLRYDGTVWTPITPTSPLVLGVLGSNAPTNGGRIYYKTPSSYVTTDAVDSGSTSKWRVLASDETVLLSVDTTGDLQVGGTPLFQRGSNSNGEYIRFSDGTQICWRNNFGIPGSGKTWTFPAAFISMPNVQLTMRNFANFAYIGTPTTTSVVVDHSASGTFYGFLLAIGFWK